MTPFPLGLHLVDNQYTDAQRATHLDWLRKIKPAYINILGGAQHKQAMQFAHEVRRDVPATQVIFRHYVDGGDDGLWTRIPDPGWFVEVCEIWGYHQTDWYIVTDNEANATDLRPYAKWTAAVMAAASKVGLKLAVGRFSTHNPALEKINAGQLDAMWQALADHPEHIWSPNAYFDTGNHDGLKHIKVGLRRMEAVTGKKITPVLGEYAYAMNLDPHKGYKSARANSADIVNLGWHLLRQYLPGVPACWYSVGAWPIHDDTFGLDDAGLNKLVALSQAYTPPPVVLPPPEPEAPAPPPAPTPEPPQVPLADYLKILKQQHRFMEMEAARITARQLALDAQAQQVQAWLVELSDLIEQHLLSEAS